MTINLNSLREAAEKGLAVDSVAQAIRIVDGSNSLGAGALAEALLPHIVTPELVELIDSHARMEAEIRAAITEAEAIGPAPTHDTYGDRRRLMLGVAKMMHHLRSALTVNTKENEHG